MTSNHKFNCSLFIFGLMILLFVSQTIQAAPRGVLYDYFGTGRSDFVYFDVQGENFRWNILRNPVTDPPQTRNVSWGFPFPDDYYLLGDYDGDMKNDIGVWRPGSEKNPQSYFYMQLSTNPNPNQIHGVPWGLPDDVPQEGDWDGDGKHDFTVARKEGENYSHYFLPSGGGDFRRIVFGLTSDFLYNGGGNFNGDELDDIVVFREASDGQGFVYAADSATGNLVFAEQWGTAAGYEVGLDAFGDYIGDSRADLVHIYGKCGGCPNEGTWWIKETGGEGIRVVKFGIPLNKDFEGDIPLYDVDYDGDGKLDIAVGRLENHTYYVLRSSDGQLMTQYWDGSSTSPPSDAANLFENALVKPRGKSIPAAALKAIVTVKQPDGTYQSRRASEFYLKK